MYFEFADSEVAECMWQDGRLQLRFSAAQLRHAQDARAEPMWAPVLLWAEHAEPWEAPPLAACIGRLRQGVLLHASQRMQKLPLPCQLPGVVTLELEFAQGDVVHVRCQGVSLQLAPGAVVDGYQC